MTTADNTQAALLAALKAIVNECKTFVHDHDSYLPPHLLQAAQQAIALAEGADAGKLLIQPGGAGHE